VQLRVRAANHKSVPSLEATRRRGDEAKKRCLRILASARLRIPDRIYDSRQLVYELAQAHLRGEVLRAMSSAYRVATHAAVEWREDGIAWLRGSEGVTLRRRLAEAAYDALPARIGPAPVGA
jgi:hypothetical protein